VTRRFVGYFILFLCIGVMNRELPECMALRDDVSNDGDVAVYSLQAPQAVASRADTLDPGPASAFSKDSFPLLVADGRWSRVPAAVAHSGVDLLRLMDQQRC
jgi:hypothetical protein